MKKKNLYPNLTLSTKRCRLEKKVKAKLNNMATKNPKAKEEQKVFPFYLINPNLIVNF